MERIPAKGKPLKTEVLVLLAPVVLVFALFTVVPFAMSLVISFFRLSGSGRMEFIGLQNYLVLLTGDANFARSALSSLYIFLASVLPQILISLGLALILNNKLIRLKGLFRAVFFMPYITSGISIAVIFMNMFPLLEPYGVANYLMNLLGLKPTSWIGNADTFFMTIGLVMNWRFIGWNMILYIASLSSVPESVYEAADLDGAGILMRLRNITLPHLVPILFFTFTMATINAVQAFNEPFMFTGGTLETGSGPLGLGRPLAVYIIWLMRRAQRLDRASAVAWILFIVILAFTVVNRIMLNRINRD
jgi:cellobiose transport system permease protein